MFKLEPCSFKGLAIIVIMLAIITGCTISGNSDQSLPPEWIKYQDEKTSREVWQITTHEKPSVACYFENQAFSSGDRYVIFSSKRSGTWQIYRADLHGGEMKQLSRNERNILGDEYTVMPDGKHVSYLDGWSIYSCDIETGVEELLIDLSGKVPSLPLFTGSFTNDGKYTLVSVAGDSLKAIYRINLESGEVLEVHRQKEGRISHPMINPEDPGVISYVPGPDTQNDMTLPMEMRARTWKVDLHKGTDQQFLTVPYGFRATHESWTADGSRFTFFRKTRPGWSPAAVCSIDKDGNDFRVHYVNDTIKLGHGTSSSDGKWFISDSQQPGTNELMLINLLTGDATLLCYPDASIEDGNDKYAHVHPSFSRSGKFVAYTSDRTGIPQVYVVPVEDITQAIVNGQ